VDREGIVKITDFGLARSATEITHDTVVRGTPFYMSPEQIQGLQSDYRSDIYSFGCTLYRMFTKRPPFNQGNISNTCTILLFRLPHQPEFQTLNRLNLSPEKARQQRYRDVIAAQDLQKIRRCISPKSFRSPLPDLVFFPSHLPLYL
jgi:serine/threonine protein kinase